MNLFSKLYLIASITIMTITGVSTFLYLIDAEEINFYGEKKVYIDLDIYQSQIANEWPNHPISGADEYRYFKTFLQRSPRDINTDVKILAERQQIYFEHAIYREGWKVNLISATISFVAIFMVGVLLRFIYNKVEIN